MQIQVPMVKNMNINPDSLFNNVARWLPDGVAVAAADVAGKAKAALSQGWAAAYSVSVAAPDAVAGLQSSAAAIIDKYCGPALTELAGRTVSPVFGGLSAGTGAVIAAPFVFPVLGTLFNALQRTGRSIIQRRCTNAALRRAEDCGQRKEVDAAGILHRRATQLRNAGDKQKALTERKASHWDSFKYLATFVAPIAALPQLAILTGVTAPVALPVACGLGAAACAARFVITRFDSWRERAQAQDFIDTAGALDVKVDYLLSVKELRDNVTKLSQEVAQRGQCVTDLQEKLTEEVSAKDEALEACKEAEQACGAAKNAQREAQEEFLVCKRAFVNHNRILEGENAKLQRENDFLKSRPGTSDSNSDDGVQGEEGNHAASVAMDTANVGTAGGSDHSSVFQSVVGSVNQDQFLSLDEGAAQVQADAK